MSHEDLQAVLLTGVYGSGKTSIAEELAAVLDDREMFYASIDLDWLGCFDVGWDDERAQHGVVIANLRSLMSNYMDAAVEYFVVASSIEHEWELEAIRAAVAVPLQVVRLVVDADTSEQRAASDTTSAGTVNLHWARQWVRRDLGAGLEDFVVVNDRPPRHVAAEIAKRLGW